MPPGRTRVQVRDALVPQASRRAVSRPRSRPARVSLSLSGVLGPDRRTAPHRRGLLAQVRTWPSPASHWGRAHHRSIEVGVLLVTVVPQLVLGLKPWSSSVPVGSGGTHFNGSTLRKEEEEEEDAGGEGNGRVKEPRGRGKDFPKISFNISWKKTFVHEGEISHFNIRKYRKSFVTLPGRTVVWPRRSRGEEEGGKPWGKKLR